MTPGLSSPEPEDGGAVSAERVAMPAESSADGLTGSIADGKADDSREALRGDLARTLTAAFKPASEYRRPNPADETALVLFTATDGHTSMRPLTFGEIADVLLNASWRRVVEDDDTCREVGIAVRDALTRASAQDYDSPTAAWSAVGRAAVRALREDA